MRKGKSKKRAKDEEVNGQGGKGGKGMPQPHAGQMHWHREDLFLFCASYISNLLT